MANKTKFLEKWDFILFLGESGGGKGTLIKKIKDYWLPDLRSASMGDIFRKKAEEDPEIKAKTEQGILIDDATVFSIFKDYAEANKPGIIDGYPRNRQQAIDLIRFVKEKGWRVLVIDISCSIEVIIGRLLARQRPDDTLTVIYSRHTDHKNRHPLVMAELETRPDLFDILRLDGNNDSDITFSNFVLSVIRFVDMLYFYDLDDVETHFGVENDETSVNPAINRWISGFLRNIQGKIEKQNPS